jgi:S1-C subfamily serine protease
MNWPGKSRAIVPNCPGHAARSRTSSGRCIRAERTVAIFALATCAAIAIAATTNAQDVPTAVTNRDVADRPLTPEDLAAIRAVENERIRVIEKVIGSVIAIYGEDRQGGGSGVIIDPRGIALTNHHVIEGAGLSGLGGLSDGNLYPWELVGTDPGGDVAVIRMKGRDDFPHSPLGNSDEVQIGDWALAMGNPFLLAHDQVPTVTLGIVSGVNRFQEGTGSHQLVYGNCIQVDSSINPGNSGGPLFNMQGEVIGINGRGSFRDRGRVNVGLGYAISSRQIRNFLPDLLATKIVEHGTLDASFSDRDGEVVCSTLNLDSPAATAGLELGDVLLEFDGESIQYANQFKNLVCMLPEGWPASFRIRKADGRELAIHVRMYGLPYNFQADEETPQPEPQPDDPDQPPDDDGEQPPPDEPAPTPEAAEALRKYLLSEHGVVLDEETSQAHAAALLDEWRLSVTRDSGEHAGWSIRDEIVRDGQVIGEQSILIAADGRFRVVHNAGEGTGEWVFDGKEFARITDGKSATIGLIEAKTSPVLVQAAVIAAALNARPLTVFGDPVLDGSDKAAGRLASRIMFLDADDDWLYCWLGEPETGQGSDRLPRKVSAHRDCLGNGGIMFDDWEWCEGLRVPRQRQLVTGLEEKPQWTARTVDCAAIQDLANDAFEIGNE